MKCPFLILLIICFVGTAFGQSTKTGDAKSQGQCTAANTGSNNRFVINCGIGKKQGAEMLAILNKVLANQIDPNAVMTKLDEILNRTNPNLTVVAYDCQGTMRSTNLSTGVMQYGRNYPFANIKPMDDLLVRRLYPDLLTSCLAQISQKPEWLTPRLLCGEAYSEMGDRANALTMLGDYEKNAGPGYNTDPYCRALDSALRQKLQVTPLSN